jgi:hypothetical protein
MAEEPVPEEGGVVEAFGERTPILTIPPTLNIPSRTVHVEIFYVTSEQLETIASNARASSEHLALGMFEFGLVLSIVPTMVAGDALHAKHPIWFDIFLFLALAAFLSGISQLLSWSRIRKSSTETITKIKTSQK